MIYLKENFQWDYEIFIDRISRIYINICQDMEDFSEFLENKNSTGTEIQVEEDYGESHFDKELIESLTRLSENLENQVFYNTLVISIYSYFEFSLVEFCRLIDIYTDSEPNFEDIKGMGLKQARKYLAQIFDLRLEKFENYQRITDMRKFRNLVVHNNANLFKDLNKPLTAQPDYLFFQHHDKFDVTSSGYIFINDLKQIKKFLDISNKFIGEILNRTKPLITK